MAGSRALLWLLVPIAALGELGAHLYFSARPPRFREYDALVPALSRLRQKDELVVVAPDWAEPNVRRAVGDAFMPLRDVARPDVSAYSRAIEVSILGASAPELANFRLLEEHHEGKFRIRLLQNPEPAAVRFDFLDHVEAARVRDGDTACPWNPHARRSAGGLHGNMAYPPERHECDSDSHFVGATVIEDQNWRARRCLWAKPRRKSLSIEFHDVPLGNVVRGYSGESWFQGRERKGGVFTVTVRVDGADRGRFEHKDGQGWTPFEIPTPGSAEKTGTVEFRVDVRGPGDRELCFQADTR